MRSRAPLALMEQMVMIVVFALAAALCLQAFVKSDALSRRSEARDRAVLLAQSVAEAVRHSGGDVDGAVAEVTGARPAEAPGRQAWGVDYDGDWNVLTDGGAAYRLTVRPVDAAVAGLGRVSVAVSAVTDGGEDTLFQIEAAWQEVSGHG